MAGVKTRGGQVFVSKIAALQWGNRRRRFTHSYRVFTQGTDFFGREVKWSEPTFKSENLWLSFTSSILNCDFDFVPMYFDTKGFETFRNIYLFIWDGFP